MDGTDCDIRFQYIGLSKRIPLQDNAVNYVSLLMQVTDWAAGADAAVIEKAIAAADVELYDRTAAPTKPASGGFRM